MNHYVLPFTIDVELKAYHNTAFPLGAIKATIPDYETWLCNNYINCIYGRPDYRPSCWKLESYYSNRWFVDKGLTHVQNMFLDSATFKGKGLDIIRLNKEMLRENFYINGGYNEYYIKGKKSYKKKDFIHDYIIFGYDDERSVFKSAAYQLDRSYGFCDIEYEDFYNSIVGSKTECLETHYIRINKNYEPQIDIKSIKESLGKYLYSEKEPLTQHLQGYFGMEAWGKFEEYVRDIGEHTLDLRFSRVYMEHRNLMYKRMQKLWELGYLRDGTLPGAYYQKVCLPAMVTHRLFLKYTLKKDSKVLARIPEIIRKTNETEAEIIGKLIEAIG